jgi:hypothetical protein
MAHVYMREFVTNIIHKRCKRTSSLHVKLDYGTRGELLNKKVRSVVTPVVIQSTKNRRIITTMGANIKTHSSDIYFSISGTSIEDMTSWI